MSAEADQSDNLSAKSIRMLERLFESEVNAAIQNKGALGCLYQTKNKSLLAELEFLGGMGLAKETTITLPGRFPVTVKGWTLTELGRLTYCTSL